MKHLVLAVSVLIMLTLPGWGQATSNEQARAGAAAHRQEAKNNQERPQHRHKHRRHHKKHTSA
jgi:hypothetical protein